ncbi:hypothetical protein AB0C07_37415 [Actinoplanes missouriensis]|uniref:hypothetical protein n=1 Tax=Actinoplanes missouriensis TaxID=1866 RepID=UPI0033EA7829
MRKRTIRATLVAVLLTVTSAFFVDLTTGAASAATTPTLLTDQQRHAITGFHADRMIVDGARQRLLIADDVAHRILAVKYDGTVVSEVALPDGANATDLQLSVDGGTLWTALPDTGLIVSWDAATLTEIKRYPVVAGRGDLGHIAVAEDKVWYTYRKNYFASLDPATGDVTTHVLGAGTNTSASERQPLLAVSPADSSRLMLTDADSRGDLFLYDTHGGAVGVVTSAQSGLTSGHSSLEYTADGSMIYTGGVNGVYYTWTDDLSPSSGRTISMAQAVDVEVASNDYVAVGVAPSTTATDLRIYPAAETAATREFDFPISGAAPSLVDLAWSPTGDTLFAITDQAGTENLWVIDKPSVVPSPPAPVQTATAITLTGPSTAGRGAGINVRGNLSGGLPMGTSVKVVRTDADSPAGVAVTASDTSAKGDFSFLDSPQAGGTITYTVSYPGDATHKPSSAKISVTVPKTTPGLTLDRNGSVNAYGATVSLTAKLGATHKNRTVEIWADPYGADQPRRLLKKGVVNSAGALSVNYKLTRNTTVSAVFAGDTRYAARTVTSALKTRVAVSTAVTKHYKVARSYHYVRKATNPKFTTTMTAYPKRKQTLVFQQYSGGRWKAWKSGAYTLSGAGTYTFTLTGTHKTGVNYRVRAVYTTGTSGDSANYTTYGAWKYFRFTK